MEDVDKSDEEPSLAKCDKGADKGVPWRSQTLEPMHHLGLLRECKVDVFRIIIVCEWRHTGYRRNAVFLNP